MRLVLFGAALLVVVSVPIGCSKSSRSKRTHEMVVKDSIVSVQAVVDSMNGVRDAASAQRAEEVIRRETDHLQKLKDELTALGQPSRSAKERAQKHTQEMVDVSERLKQATAMLVPTIRSGQLPRDTATRLSNVGTQYGMAMVALGTEMSRLLEI